MYVSLVDISSDFCIINAYYRFEFCRQAVSFFRCKGDSGAPEVGFRSLRDLELRTGEDVQEAEIRSDGYRHGDRVCAVSMIITCPCAFIILLLSAVGSKFEVDAVFGDKAVCFGVVRESLIILGDEEGIIDILFLGIRNIAGKGKLDAVVECQTVCIHITFYSLLEVQSAAADVGGGKSAGYGRRSVVVVTDLVVFGVADFRVSSRHA